MTPKEALASLEAQMSAASIGRIRGLVKDYAAELALLNIDEGHSTAERREIKKKQEQLSFRFATRLTRLTRTSGTKFRHVVLDGQLYALLRETLQSRAGRFLTILIIRHAPAKEATTQDISNWSDQLTATEEQAIVGDLRYRRLPAEELDTACFDALVTVTYWLYADQLVLIARQRRGQKPWEFSSVSRAIFEVLAAVDYDWEEASKLWSGAVSEIEGNPEAFLDKLQNDTIEARLPGWIITTIANWKNVVVKIKERLPTVLQSDPHALPEHEPRGWDLFSKNTDQLLICWGRFQLGQPRSFLDTELRRLSAVCECLIGNTEDSDAGRTIDFEPDQVVAANVITIPLQRPHASGKRPFDHGFLIENGFGELTLPKWPITDIDDLKMLETEGLVEILNHLRTDDETPLCRAIYFFEAARSVGGAYGIVPAEIEQGWRLATLCSCLEKLCNTSQFSRDLKKSVIEEHVWSRLSNQRDKAVDLVHRAFEWRNDHIHDSEYHLWGDFDAFYSVVRDLLAVEMKAAAGLI